MEANLVEILAVDLAVDQEEDHKNILMTKFSYLNKVDPYCVRFNGYKHDNKWVNFKVPAHLAM